MPTCSRSLSLGSCLLLGACFSPTGQTTDAGSDASTGSAGPTGTSGSTAAATSSATVTSTEPTTTSPASATATSQDPTSGGSCNSTCEPPTPYCAPGGGCISCEDLEAHAMSCGIIDEATPYCDKDDTGLCVECLSPLDCEDPLKCNLGTHTCETCAQDLDCTASETAPICDDGDCRGCREHSECPVTACDTQIGSCFPVAETHPWYVTSAPQCQEGACTIDQPCCTISEVFDAINIGTENFNVIHVEPGIYATGIHLTANGRRVAVLGQTGVQLDVVDPGKALILVGYPMDAMFIDSKLFLSKLDITGEGSVGFSCYEATYGALDDVRMHDVVGDSLFVADCELAVRRSTFVRNYGGLRVTSEGIAKLENSVISNTVMQPALSVVMSGQLDVLYSTIALQGVVASGLLYCTGGIVSIRNSAVLAGNVATNVDCGAPVFTSYSITTEPELMGTGVENVGNALVADPFVDWDTGDLRLANDGTFLKNIALWTEVDPETDIEGTLRPTVDGTMDVAGADLPGP